MVGPVDTLSFDVLLNVFALLVTLRDLTTASHVCSLWRQAILDSPTLWAAIISTSAVAPSALAPILARSKDAPIFLKLRLMDHAQAKIGLLQKHLGHAYGLQVIIPQGRWRSNLWQRLMDVLCSTPAPNLRVFGLGHSDERREYLGLGARSSSLLALPRNVFAGHAPHLHTVSVYCVRLSGHPYPAFRTLQTLCTEVSHDGGPLDDSQPSNFLPDGPCYDGFRRLVFRAGIPLRPGIPTHRAVLEQLEHLELAYFDGVEDVHRMLLARPWATSLCIYDARANSALDWLLASSDDRPYYIRVLTEYYFYPTPQHFLETRHAGGHVRELKFKPHTHNAGLTLMTSQDASSVLTALVPLDHTAFGRITALVIHERYWPPWPVDAPLLADLTVFIVHPSTGEQRVWPEYVGVLDAEEPARPWVAPELRNVTIACPDSHRRITSRTARPPHDEPRGDERMLAGPVLRFLGQHLSFSAERPLELLRLKRLYLAGAPGSDDMVGLHAVVRHVETISMHDEPGVQLSDLDEVRDNLWFYSHWDKLFT